MSALALDKSASLETLRRIAVEKNIPPSGSKAQLIERINNGIERKKPGKKRCAESVHDETSLLSPKQAFFKKQRSCVVAMLDTDDKDEVDEELERQWALSCEVAKKSDDDHSENVSEEEEEEEEATSYLKRKLPHALTTRILRMICDVHEVATTERDDDGVVHEIGKDALVSKVACIIDNAGPGSTVSDA